MKKVFGILSAVGIALVLAACGETSSLEDSSVASSSALQPVEATAYGITHKAYLGVVDMTVLGDVVTDVEFEEYHIPSTWAKLTFTTAPDPVPADVVVTGTSTLSYFAKYISIGGKKFTGAARTGTLVLDGISYTAQTVNYSSQGISDLFVWLTQSQANAKWYVEALNAGEAFVANAFEAAVAPVESTAGYTLSTSVNFVTNDFTKSGNGYWSGEAYPTGWAGNMTALETYLEGKVFNYEALMIRADETVGDPGQRFWTIDGTVTGVTMSDLYEYMLVAAIAYSLTQA